MTYYAPDKWVVLKVPTGYKVLGGWSGGYLDGSTWRLNSGIVRVEEELDWKDEKSLMFYGHSGSVYRCYKRDYGFNSASIEIFISLMNQAPGMIELLSADTNWMELDYDGSRRIL
jgi:hypothetical protein